MKKGEYNIDFKVIWKKINSSLSEAEEAEFQNWMNSEFKHQQFFEKVNHYYQTGKVKDYTELDIKKAWESVEPKLISTKKRIIPDWLKIGVSVAATVLIMLLVYRVVDKEPEAQLVQLENMEIPPGTSKARLIFDNGETVELNAGQNFHGEVDGAKVENKGNELSYAKSETPFKQVKFNTIEIPRGAEYFLILSDGTKVWLNSDTRLRYPVAFVGDERNVELISGEAFFNVTENAEKPFKVKSAGQVVEVLGTEFNVSSYGNSELVYTTLVEGKVTVSSESNPENVKHLLPGFQTYLYKESGDISIRKVDVKEYVAWKDGAFYFKKKTLEDMMNTIARWYDIEVEFLNPDMKKILFTGEIKRYENLEKMLHLIEKTEEVKFEMQDDKIIIN